MTQDEYMKWWISLPDDYAVLGEPVRTLVLHIEALQERIMSLPDGLNCCCAFDYPADVCMTHHKPRQPEESR